VGYAAAELPYVNFRPVVPPVQAHPLVIRCDAKGSGRFWAPRSGGRRHRGVDVIAPLTSPVRAIRSGRVAQVGVHRGLGRFVEIEHRRRLATLYAHLDAVSVDVGDRVRQGAAIALVTDAGTPAVSDPGAELVRLALREGIPVRAVPGPSALTALLSVAGIEDRTFCFRGFFPRGEEAGVREAALAAGTRASRTFVWFESPGRVESTVGILARQCPGARLVAGKELTKLHEKVFSGPAPESAREIALEIAREGARGEWVIALVAEPARPGESHAMEAKNSEETWKIALECAIAAGARPSSAASIVGQKFGVARNVVYERALELGGKKSSRGT